MQKANLMTYYDYVLDAFTKLKDQKSISKWTSIKESLSHRQAVTIASSLGFKEYWCWDAPRTREGYYRLKGGIECAIKRAIEFAPYADLCWMESALPSYKQAEMFALQVKNIHPNLMLAYNLSPSFNWDKADMSDLQIGSFVEDLAKLGYVWQFITLAGLHVNSLAIDTFAKDFKQRGMLAYVQGVQRKERELGVETLAHQKWAGADYTDELMKVCTNGTSSTAAMGNGVTESQF